MLVILLSSGVVLIAALLNCFDDDSCQGDMAFALAAGAVGVFVSGAWTFSSNHPPLKGAAEKALPLVALLLCMWWFLCAVVLTFSGPFTSVGNGYIAAWVAAVASIHLGMLASEPLQKVTKSVKDTVHRTTPIPRTSVLILLGASAVELTAAAILCGGGSCAGTVAYSVAVGAVGLFLGMVIAAFPSLPPALHRLGRHVALFNALWWTAGTLCLTFVSPFVGAGNGFFATWLAVVYSWIIPWEMAPASTAPTTTATPGS